MEKLVRSHILNHMKSQNLFTKRQYGFISGRSTSLQLLEVLDKWTEALDNGHYVDCIYMDFQKAFDKVPHKRLLEKIKSYGIVAVWETIFFKHLPKWRVDWNKYSPKWNRACHVWRVTFFLNSPTICNKYQVNNTVMFNNLFYRFWQVINLVKKDQHSLKSCVDLFFLNFQFRCLRLLSFNARYKTCMSNPVPTHI